METLLDIPCKDIKMTVQFPLNEHDYSISGSIVWMKHHYDRNMYGIQFSLGEEMQERLLNDLKLLGKTHVKKL